MDTEMGFNLWEFWLDGYFCEDKSAPESKTNFGGNNL